MIQAQYLPTDSQDSFSSSVQQAAQIFASPPPPPRTDTHTSLSAHTWRLSHFTAWIVDSSVSVLLKLQHILHILHPPPLGPVLLTRLIHHGVDVQIAGDDSSFSVLLTILLNLRRGTGHVWLAKQFWEHLGPLEQGETMKKVTGRGRGKGGGVEEFQDMPEVLRRMREAFKPSAKMKEVLKMLKLYPGELDGLLKPGSDGQALETREGSCSTVPAVQRMLHGGEGRGGG